MDKVPVSRRESPSGGGSDPLASWGTALRFITITLVQDAGMALPWLLWLRLGH
jgi:hypothetical protein